MSHTAPEISAIVCTRDRPEALMACLRSLHDAARRRPARSVEIIVVESGSRTDLRLDGEQVALLQARLVRNARGGLSHARNVGMECARAPVFFFTDDDCLAAEDVFDAVAEHAAAADEAFIVGGRVLPGAPDNLPLTLRQEAEPELFTRDKPPGGFLQGCNVAMARLTREMIGPFDETLGAGTELRSGEDTDYAIRCHIAGLPVRYDPSIVVYHDHGRRTLESARQVHRGYCIGNGALHLRYWRQPWLGRQFYWVLRSALRERFGGEQFDPANGLTWWDVLSGNVAGMALEARLRLAGGAPDHDGQAREGERRAWRRERTRR